ncbi:MAG: hypothetical protein Q8O76_13345, partial [Chloroflexota bacterium]|nr:hypothetical protein [Chloroflexota bacterium]
PQKRRLEMLKEVSVMKRTAWLGLILGAVVLVVLGGSALAAATGQTANTYQVLEQPWIYGGGYWDAGTLTRVAQALGISPDELRTQLGSGKTLLQIAQDKNVAAKGVVDAILSTYKNRLQAQVQYGYLTQEQADRLLSQAEQRVTVSLAQPQTPYYGYGTPSYGGWDQGHCPYGSMGGYGPGGMMGGWGGQGMMGGRGWGGQGMMGGRGWGSRGNLGGSGWGGQGMMGGRGMMGGW